MNKALRILAISAATLFFVAAGVFALGYHMFSRPGPLSQTKIVLIPKGADLDAITTMLEREGVIDRTFIFRLGVRLGGWAGKLKAGELRFPAAVSQQTAVRVLMEGKSVLRRLTVAEGLTVAQVLVQIEANKNLWGTVADVPAEGEVLPETYYYVFHEDRDELIARMRRAMTRALDAAWANRAEGLPFKTKRQALILASIIEKETSRASERRRVAGVFVNRLRRGMRLQSDPTVIYGITRGKGPLGRRLLRKDLQRPSRYNTYLIKGLPPGPIANPGRAAIAAAVNPLKTKDLYFVANGTGGHAFAATLAQHNRNVTRWRRIQRQRRRRTR